MKKLESILLLFLSCFLLMPLESAYAQNDIDMRPDPPPKPHQDIVPDTVKDPHSKLTAKYSIKPGLNCTAVLISSTAALTARHCVMAKPGTPYGTIYPGANGEQTPFGYMNIREVITHPNYLYDIAILKGNERDQDKFYKYYIGKFKTKVKGYSDQELQGFVGKEAYSYGYPKLDNVYHQYRSDGSITYYVDSFKSLYTTLPSYGGQSGSAITLKSGQLVGIITHSTVEKHEAHALALTTEIAEWINKNAN